MTCADKLVYNDATTCTYLRTSSHQFIVQSLSKACKEGSASRENDITQKNTSQIRVTLSQRLVDQNWDRSWQIGIRTLAATYQGCCKTEHVVKLTTNSGLCEKYCSPTMYRSGPKKVLYPDGNSYCRCGRLCARLPRMLNTAPVLGVEAHWSFHP